ncbi:homoserine dehydrogenase [Niallia sp. 01092]|uniref:homoserine dehydrogenase n=1 Tax=unclassified Niallia TaxID=2837522 RepID=UPI003FD6A9B1
MQKKVIEKKVIITGYGTVAKELVKLLNEQANRLVNTYHAYYKIVGIIGLKGMIYEEEGIDLQVLLTYGKGSKALDQYAKRKGLSFQQPVYKGDVLIECTPTDLETGEPALSYITNALTAKMHVVSVSKGALIHALPQFKKIADTNHCEIKYSGATAAALPTLDIGEFSLAGCQITSIEGILNGTSNFILTSMSEENVSFDHALKIAQERGIVEANPDLDIKGLDSACKILLLANGLLHTQLTLKDISIEGIENVTKADIQYAKIKGNEIKLIASATVKEGEVTVKVAPVVIHPENPLIHVKGTNKGILFHTEEMGTICCLGGASHPKGAAAAALKDMINLFR